MEKDESTQIEREEDKGKKLPRLKLKVKTHNLLETYVPSHHNFDVLADIILNHTVLVANQTTFRLCEIEMYYCGTEHNDKYVHCSMEQSMNGRFYFHKYGTGTYKSGTYKGLDITLSPNSQTYFGVLIRSIYNQNTGQFIEGPCRCVNELLSHFDCTEVSQFVKDKEVPLKIYDTTYGFHLTHTQLPEETIYHGPRIGLSDKYPDYRDRHYRYATMIHQLKKKRNTLWGT